MTVSTLFRKMKLEKPMSCVSMEALKERSKSTSKN